VTAPPAPPHPGVRIPPPTFYAAAYFVAYLLHRAVPMAILGPSAAPLRVTLGWGLVIGGLGLMAWAGLTFARARTSIMPIRPARVLVRGGPYRWTRNPMYLGLTIAYVGGTLLMNSAWPLLLLPIVLISISVLVIRREERYLHGAFAEEYRDYTRRVRRWL
jgi:protein-S-isoprenylcysteine O-methyltransferase Ste14